MLKLGEKEFGGDVQPPTWAMAVKMAREVDDQLAADNKNIEAANKVKQ